MASAFHFSFWISFVLLSLIFLSYNFYSMTCKCQWKSEPREHEFLSHYDHEKLSHCAHEYLSHLILYLALQAVRSYSYLEPRNGMLSGQQGPQPVCYWNTSPLHEYFLSIPVGRKWKGQSNWRLGSSSGITRNS